MTRRPSRRPSAHYNYTADLGHVDPFVEPEAISDLTIRRIAKYAPSSADQNRHFTGSNLKMVEHLLDTRVCFKIHVRVGMS